MSSLTLGVAVAVNAITGAGEILFIIWRNFLYSGLKSWPHSEIQWASSIAKNEILFLLKKAIFSSFINDSGATYTNLVKPFLISSLT